MQYFLDNKNVIAEMGKNAREVYEEHFSLEKFKMRLRKEIDWLEDNL